MFDTSMIKKDTTVFFKTYFECMSRKLHIFLTTYRGQGWHSQYSNSLQDEHSEHRIQMSVRLSTPIHTSPAVHPSSCTMGNGSLYRV